MGGSSSGGGGPNVTQETQSSRRNGWSCPLHPLQVLAWVVSLYQVLFFYLTTAPAFIVPIQIVSYILISIFLVSFVTTLLIATTIDPADDNVRLRLKEAGPAAFDRSQHQHVIENAHCYICSVHVGLKSKHCSSCNKCVAEFDHHCKWLNNCVGQRNYRYFLVTVTSALICSLLVFIFCLVQFISYFTDEQSGDVLLPYSDLLNEESTTQSSTVTSSSGHSAVFRLFYAAVSDAAWLTLTFISLALGLIVAILLTHLLIFHIYLIMKEMTTYDYILRQRERDEVRERTKREEARVRQEQIYNQTNNETADGRPNSGGLLKPHNKIVPSIDQSCNQIDLSMDGNSNGILTPAFTNKSIGSSIWTTGIEQNKMNEKNIGRIEGGINDGDKKGRKESNMAMIELVTGSTNCQPSNEKYSEGNTLARVSRVSCSSGTAANVTDSYDSSLTKQSS